MYDLRMVLEWCCNNNKKVNIGVLGRNEGTGGHRFRTCIGQFVGWLSADLTFEDSKMFFPDMGLRWRLPATGISEATPLKLRATSGCPEMSRSLGDRTATRDWSKSSLTTNQVTAAFAERTHLLELAVPRTIGERTRSKRKREVN